jgi:hypothetical protein
MSETSMGHVIPERRIGWKTHLFVALCGWFFLFWLIPIFDGLQGGSGLDAPNEKTRVLGMASIGLFGELHINRARGLWWTRITDLSGRPRTKADGPNAPSQLLYPSKTPGMSMFLGVMYGVYRRHMTEEPPTLVRATYFARLFGTLLPTWLASLLFYFLLLQVCRSRYVILTGFFGFLLGTTMLPYGLTVSSHSFAGGMLLLSFASLVWCPRGFWLRCVGAAIAGLGIGLAFSAEYTAVLTGVWLGLFALLRTPPLPARWTSRPVPGGWKTPFVWLMLRWHLLVALAASLLPVAAVMWYHKKAFGSIWNTPYNFMLNPAFRSAMKSGGFLGYNWPPSFEKLLLMWFSPATGLCFWTPVLLFGAWAVWLLFRLKKWHFLVPFVGLMGWWLMYPGLLSNPRGGWSVGPRYISNLIPFGMLAAVWAADQLYMRYGNRMAMLIGLTGVWSILQYAPASVFFPHLPTSAYVPQTEIVGMMVRRGLAPSSLLPISPGWAVFWYAVALLGVCGYVLYGGLRGRDRWQARVSVSLVLVFCVLVLVQLPVMNYEFWMSRVDVFERLIPAAYRYHW